MAKVICIAGESGTGKTTSIRNLDPTSTYIIDADKKGLSWKGWRTQYNVENKNYKATSDVNLITNTLVAISSKAPHIKTIVVDTLNSIMADDEIKKMKQKGYDKWVDMATSIWELVTDSHILRDDLTVIFIAHTQTERDESGYVFTKIKTSGKKLDKLCLESRFTTVLIAKCIEGKYIFETKSKMSTCKTPLDAFEDETIENDIANVLIKLSEY